MYLPIGVTLQFLKSKIMEWIKVEDKLPEQFEYVLAYYPEECDDPKECIGGCIYTKEIGFCMPGLDSKKDIYTFEGVTHWMSLPEPPKQN